MGTSMKRTVIRAALAAVCLAATCIFAPAWAVDRHYTCRNIKGVILTPPAWGVKPDGFAGQSVTLISTVETGATRIVWSNGTAYNGFTLEMSGGFVVIATGPYWTEVYHFNAGGLDLMMTATRGGDPLLPNISKAFHGTCRLGDK